MQGSRPPQKAAATRNSTERTFLQPGSTRATDFCWPIMLSHWPAAPKSSSRQQANLSRHYCDPDALSGIVKGSSFKSTTNTASKLADSLSLAFSLIL